MKRTPRARTVEDVKPRLPFPPLKCISVRPDVPGPEFLGRLADLSDSAKDWIVRSRGQHYNGSGPSLTLAAQGSALTLRAATELSVALHAAFDSRPVDLLIWADWQEGACDYENHVHAAVHFKSLLKKYNQKYRARVRLSIPSPDDLEPKLPLTACVYFDWFIQEAVERPHRLLAWQCFYSFILHVLRRGIRMSEGDLDRMFELNGLRPDVAEEYYTFYTRAVPLIELMRRGTWHEPRPPRAIYLKWCDIFNSTE